jgi:hypothetical protein
VGEGGGDGWSERARERARERRRERDYMYLHMQICNIRCVYGIFAYAYLYVLF